MISEMGAQMRPTSALSLSSGSPVMPAKGNHRYADGTEGNRRSIGKQANGSRIEGRKSEAGQHGGSDRDGRSEAGRALDKRAECEANQDGLQARIGGQSSDRRFDDFKFRRYRR